MPLSPLGNRSLQPACQKSPTQKVHKSSVHMVLGTSGNHLPGAVGGAVGFLRNLFVVKKTKRPRVDSEPVPLTLHCSATGDWLACVRRSWGVCQPAPPLLPWLPFRGLVLLSQADSARFRTPSVSVHVELPLPLTHRPIGPLNGTELQVHVWPVVKSGVPSLPRPPHPRLQFP